MKFSTVAPPLCCQCIVPQGGEPPDRSRTIDWPIVPQRPPPNSRHWMAKADSNSGQAADGPQGEQLTETLTVFGYDGFLAPGGPMNMQLGASLVLLWTLVFAGSVAFSDQAGNFDPI